MSEQSSRSPPIARPGLSQFSMLAAWKQYPLWSQLRAPTILPVLPTALEGRLAFVRRNRVYIVKMRGDIGSGRLLWSGERVVLHRLHPQSEQHKNELSAIHSRIHLRHRNLHQIYGTCEWNSDILVVLPQLDGWPLRTYLQDTRWADRRAIVLDVARGLLYLHSQNIVHGDMSMDNVLVARNGSYALTATSLVTHPAVADDSALPAWATFSHDSDASSTTDSDPELDTVIPRRCERFFAVTCDEKVDPEIAAEARAFLYSTDLRSDIFAFGHFVVETFTEIPPYGSQSALEILRRTATHRRPRHPGKVALTRGLDKVLWRVCLRCWHSEAGPQGLYTAQDIVDVLGRPRDDILICPFEWPSPQMHLFIWKHVRLIGQDEVKDVARVTVGKDAENGRYELRATCHEPDARVLKLIPHWSHRRGDLRPNLYSELFVWCQLQHAHIAPLVGVCHNPFDNTDCFAVPWMGGGTCIDYLREHPGADRLTIASQISDALAYLHGRAPPVMHGRIQAHSVWMTDEGTAYLCNFDFQPQRHPERGFDDSDTASIFKSQNWAAPEHGPSGARRDIFSFAMFMYELYAGHPPFPEKDLVEVYCAYRLNQRPERPDHPQLTDDVWELIRRCWRLPPYRRPSMKAVSRRLRELAAERRHTE